eukprot:Nk52_evm1s2640 gene=Nk52_evmTU1s2640
MSDSGEPTYSKPQEEEAPGNDYDNPRALAGEQEQAPVEDEVRQVKFVAPVTEKEKQQATAIPMEDPITITMEDLSYTVYVKKDGEKVGKELLKDVTGSIKPGMMTALMGPSGAGKSTLLDVIAGRKYVGEISGDLLFNGKERRKDFKRICGYVEQKDILLGALTVRSLLLFSARLRLPASVSEEVKKERVEQVIEQLDLHNCADVIIGTAQTRGISGGQAKRVNIAIELITSPSILFLDEPTSGLDSATSVEVMKVVRGICDSGVSVVCTIHQPSTDIYNLFDRLLLLVAGQTVYLGPADEACGYYEGLGYTRPENSNPADFIVAVVSGDTHFAPGPEHPKEFFAEAYKQSALAELRKVSTKRATADSKTELCAEPVLYINSMGTNAKTLIMRAVEVNRSAPGYFVKRMATTILVALVFLTVYRDPPSDDQGIRNIFAIQSLSVTFFVMGANEFVGPLIGERLFVEREKNASAYHAISYYISHIVTELPVSFIRAFFWSIILYFGVGLTVTASQFFFWLLIIFVICDLGYAMAQVFSAISPNEDVAAGAMATIPLFFVVFSGFFIQKEEIPYHWIWAYYINYLQYSLAALAINEFKYNDDYPGYTGCDIVTEILGFECSGWFGNRWGNFVMLMVIWCFVRLACMCAYIFAKPNKG